jgi:magnesium transporter
MSDAALTPESAGPDPEMVIEDNRLRPEFVAEIIEAVDAGASDRVRALVSQLHPADIADLVGLVSVNRRAQLIADLGDRMDADVIAELSDWVRDDVLAELPAEAVADMVTQLDTDDAVAIIEDMEVEQQREVLQAMPADERVAIEEALSYPEGSAGRLMQRDLIAVPEYWTIGQTIDFLRENQHLTNEFWEIFVVGPQHKPSGTMRLSWVLRAPRWVTVSDVMQREQTLIPFDMDREELAYKFQQYGLISAAVVNQAGQLVGQITVDDVVHIIAEEAESDALKLSGATEADINEPVIDAYRGRVRWLVVNFGTAIIASLIISLFGATIEQMVALAALMPIVASLGGNAGTQTMAVSVRALATNQLTASNAPRIVWKEARVAFLNGITLALLAAFGAGLWFGCSALGGVIAAAMVINIIIAGLAGVLVPLTLDRMGQDPALASSIFVTMITDSMGFLAFLGLATVFGLGTQCLT